MYCQKCGEQNENDSMFCEKCGTKIEKEEKIVFCEKCGSKMKENSQFCRNCGAQVTQDEVVQEEIKESFSNVNSTGEYISIENILYILNENKSKCSVIESVYPVIRAERMVGIKIKGAVIKYKLTLTEPSYLHKCLTSNNANYPVANVKCSVPLLYLYGIISWINYMFMFGFILSWLGLFFGFGEGFARSVAIAILVIVFNTIGIVGLFTFFNHKNISEEFQIVTLYIRDSLESKSYTLPCKVNLGNLINYPGSKSRFGYNLCIFIVCIICGIVSLIPFS